jgi:hypothetical protein
MINRLYRANPRLHYWRNSRNQPVYYQTALWIFAMDTLHSAIWL